MKLAFLNLRYTVPERQEAFMAGFAKLGFKVQFGLCVEPQAGDVMCTWNRIGTADEVAKTFTARGLPVIVAENASWGNDLLGRHWYTLGREYHNEAGRFPLGGDDRWDRLGVRLEPWRTGGETVVLPSRGIGPHGPRMPAGWALRQSGRVRPHPGRGRSIPLDQDLANAGKVVTWGSGAAIKALMWGIRVESHMPIWIGEQDNTDEGRLAMFRRLAWAQWTTYEIATGEPFARLLSFKPFSDEAMA